MLTRFRPLLLLAVAMLAGALALPAHALQFNYSTRLTLTDCNDADEAGFQSGLTMLCYDLTAGRDEIWNGSAWVAYQGGGSSGGTTTTLIDGATATTSTSAAAASNGQGARVIGYATSGTYDATITVYGTNVDCGSSCSAASLGATPVGTITTDGGSVDDSNYLYHFALITAYTSGTISAKVVPTQAVYLWYGQANVSAANPLPITGAGASSEEPAYVVISSSVYGPPAHQTRLDFSGTAGTGDNAVMYTSGDISNYKTHYFWQSASGGSLSVQVLLPDATWSDDVALEDLHSTTPTTLVTTATASVTKIYRLKGTFLGLRVLQNGATASGVRGYHAGGE